MKNFLKKLEKFFLIDDTPHRIAAGAAIGVFFGVTPGEGLLTALVVASIFKCNRLAASAAVAITNMWTTIAILPLAAILGGWLFGTDSSELINKFNQDTFLNWKYFFSKAIFMDIALPLLVGYIICAFILSGIVYFLLNYFLRHKKHIFIGRLK